MLLLRPHQIGLYGIMVCNAGGLRSKAGRYIAPVRPKMHLGILRT